METRNKSELQEESAVAFDFQPMKIDNLLSPERSECGEATAVNEAGYLAMPAGSVNARK